ncbi:Xaa-Pro dipeptidase [Planomicrobium stackebrandtii]|uniref:Xaa-Pro dipeptidase n=1 Tax=Planomicrobium stackebrandtii TaxID=253160 RepID=A0ABU0GTX2_9BACL|nr:Xaa-Pro peptidase family protein [Planomicrobium stackebrandtii]MDQ0428807.1 Xaa-Pro dipeptidase [Planomicrobium stackebrandtii]
MNTKKRIQALRERMENQEIEVSIVMNFENQYYFSGLKALTYSRPIVLVIDKQETALIVPSLEEEHSKEKANVDRLYVYHETKLRAEEGRSHLEHLAGIMRKYPAGTKVGIEFSSFPVKLERLLEEQGFQLVNLDQPIAEMRYIKDQEEIDLITESGRLVSLAVESSIGNVKAGMTEMEFDQFGTNALFTEVARKHPNATLDYFAMSPSGLARTNMPHVFSNTRKLEEQDILIHSRQVGLNGYRAECERTFFIGQPTERQKELFHLVLEAQLAALDFIKVGVTAKEVNEVARKIFEKGGVEEYMNHRTGHGIGIGLHEEPSLRYDNDLVLQEGMVFCVEPGLYIPDVGGFRHSDTVVLTKKGTNLITHYPNDLESLIIGDRVGKLSK